MSTSEIRFEDYEDLLWSEVNRVAGKFRNFTLIDRDDLFGEACLVFTKCLQSWVQDESKGPTYQTFASYLIVCIRKRWNENVLRDLMRRPRDGAQRIGEGKVFSQSYLCRPRDLKTKVSVHTDPAEDLQEEFRMGRGSLKTRTLVKRTDDYPEMSERDPGLDLLLCRGEISETAFKVLTTLKTPPPAFVKQYRGQLQGRRLKGCLMDFLGLTDRDWKGVVAELSAFAGDTVATDAIMHLRLI